MEQAKEEIHSMANDENLKSKASILILANKQDLETAMGVEDLI